MSARMPPFCSNCTPSTPIISIREGQVQGKRLVEEPNFKADAFLGIPYAQPPVGELRFRKPVAPTNCWTGVRECFEHAKKCYQISSGNLRANDQDWPMSEDCLYLNVFCPSDYESNSLPVMVYIHGGRFAFGSAKAYGDIAICDGLVRQGVIVVTVQSRLGILGYFSTGDEVCPGNFGLWDIVEALKWIQNNISSFGGDKNNVTLFGQSSGGSSAHLLAHSPHTEGLFDRVIAMSGNAHSERSHRHEITEYSKKYAEKEYGVTAETSHELIHKLRCLPADRMATVPEKDIMAMGFCPVIDGDLFPRSIKELSTTARVMPLLGGLTTLESALYVKEADVTMEMLEQAVASMLPENSTEESRTELVRMYTEVGRIKQPKHEMWRAMAEVKSDRMFNTSMIESIQRSIERGAPTYLYVFDYYNLKCLGPSAEKSPSKDTCHCSEVAYVFNSGVGANFSFCDHDKQMAEMTMKAFTNFAKTGKPNTDGESSWLPCDRENPSRHMVIDLKPRMEEQFKEGRCEKWMEISE